MLAYDSPPGESASSSPAIHLDFAPRRSPSLLRVSCRSGARSGADAIPAMATCSNPQRADGAAVLTARAHRREVRCCRRLSVSDCPSRSAWRATPTAQADVRLGSVKPVWRRVSAWRVRSKRVPDASSVTIGQASMKGFSNVHQIEFFVAVHGSNLLYSNFVVSLA